MTTLVGYATAHGSTRTIAERVAVRLTGQGAAAEARAMSGALTPAGYHSFVLGSAIHDGDWLPAGGEFLRRHRTALAGRPVWLFSVGTVGERSSAFPQGVAMRLRQITPLTPAVTEVCDGLRPRDHHAFAGVITASDWGLAGRVFMKGLAGHYGDHRDWPEIDAWADAVSADLLGMLAPARVAG